MAIALRRSEKGLRSDRCAAQSQRRVVASLGYNRGRLLVESLEDRCLLSVAPLNVALISDAVAQAEQIRAASHKIDSKNST